MVIYVKANPEDYHGEPIDVSVSKIVADKYYTYIETDKGNFKRSSEYDIRLPYGWEKMED